MKVDGDDLIFSTGKVIYANNGIVGISPNGEITEGYDGAINATLTSEEKQELADYAIEQWTKWRKQ